MNPALPVSKLAAAGSPPPKKSNLKWFLLAGIVLLIGLGVRAYLKKKTDGQTVIVTTEKAITKTIMQIVSATGKVQPEVEVKIAPEVSGEVVKLPFREGAVVKKGDLLLSIKPDVYQAQVEQQQASLVAARTGVVLSKAQLLKSKDDLKRAEKELDDMIHAHEGTLAGALADKEKERRDKLNATSKRGQQSKVRRNV